MRLLFQGAEPYEPTPSDKLWLLRAVAAEGPVESQVARALVNLFGLLRSKGDGRTLEEVVRAYAQPVNPRWYPEGALFKSHVPNPTPAELTIAQRRKDVHSTRKVFSPDVQAAVDYALSHAFASDITDYAAHWLDASKKGYAARSEPQPGVNRLWARSPGWPGYVVENGANGALVALGLVALVAVALRGKT